MLTKKIALCIRNALFRVVAITILLSLWNNNISENKLISSPDDFELKGAVFADTDRINISIKVCLLFCADLDDSQQVDGRDLAMLMHFFGKTESEYKSESFGVNPDINGDKIVDGEDLVILASHFGLKR